MVRKRGNAGLDWPAYTVERWPIARLKASERNARTHSAEQIEQIRKAIRTFGWTVPILIREDGTLIAGHGRLTAALAEGITEAPVIVARGWSEEQCRAYALADNKIALNSGWDDELLGVELSELRALGMDLDLTGFAVDEIEVLLVPRSSGLTDPDAAPEPPVDPVSRLGDLWGLGAHRVLCGDATSAEDVKRAHDGKEADLCFTSPPYLQQRDYNIGEIPDWDTLMCGAFANLTMAPAGQVLVNLGLVHRESEWQPYWDRWIEWMRTEGWRRFGWYVWDQGPGLAGDWNGRLAPSHEFVFHFNREAERARKTKDKNPENIRLKSGTGMRRADGSLSGVSSPQAGLQPKKIADSVIRVMRHKGKSSGGHPAVFPAALAVEMVRSFSDAGSRVYDPFLGSGTTIIAAEMEGRSCLGLEIDPAYCDVIVKRWQDFTGKAATLEGDGRTFAEIETARAAPVRKRRKAA